MMRKMTQTDGFYVCINGYFAIAAIMYNYYFRETAKIYV